MHTLSFNSNVGAHKHHQPSLILPQTSRRISYPYLAGFPVTQQIGEPSRKYEVVAVTFFLREMVFWYLTKTCFNIRTKRKNIFSQVIVTKGHVGICVSTRASTFVKGRSPRLFAETVKLLKQGVCRSINEKEKVPLQFLRLYSID